MEEPIASSPGLHPVDLGIIIIYLVGITLLGVWMARRLTNLASYFMPRRFGKGMMMMHAFGTGTASDQAVTVAAPTFRNGLSGIWYQWLWLFATPFYWLIAPIFRRFRAITTADVYELRFDRSVAVLFALVGIANLAVKIGLVLKGAGVLIESGTGAMIDTNVAILVVTVLFVTYGAAGGLGAAIVTDYIQGILTIVFSFMLLPFIFSEVGGMAGVRETISDPGMLSLVAPGKITAFFIIMMGIQALVGIVAQPFIMGVCAAGRTEWEGRVGMMGGNLLKRLCTIAWALTGIAAVAWFLQQGMDLSEIDPDLVYGHVAHSFLPEIMPGLLGIFLASLLAGVMNSCDSFMISAAGLFTENIYRPLVPGRSDRHYIWFGRGIAVLTVCGGVAFALWVGTVVEALEIWFKVAPMMGLVFWIALFWRRITVAGAWSTTLGALATWWMTTQTWFINWVSSLPIAESWRLIWREEGGQTSIYEPWQIVFYMLIGISAGILVSFVTPRVRKEKLDLFYRLTRTPVQPGERNEGSCQLPDNAPPDTRKMLVQGKFDLEIPMPSRASVIGFLVGWVAVGVLIGGFILYVKGF